LKKRKERAQNLLPVETYFTEKIEAVWPKCNAGMELRSSVMELRSSVMELRSSVMDERSSIIDH